MTLPPVTIVLSLSVPPPVDMLSEAEVPAHLGAGTATFGDLFEQEGQLVITGGTVEVILGDTILNLVSAGCFAAVASLAQTGEAVIEMFATDEVITLTRTGDVIDLTGVYQPPSTLPADPLIHALFRAGERFLALAALIWPDQSEPLTELRDYADAVRPLLPAVG